MKNEIDVCIIGGGAAGMSAALGAVNNGAEKVMIIEKDIELGGILSQCIHNGFGLHHFHEELTGPGYAERIRKELKATDIKVNLATTVVKITKDREVHYLNESEGYKIIKPRAIVLAAGCRERTRFQADIPGKRLAGIYTAGVAQRYLNIEGYLVGKRVFILGSGDIGLIMARRMTLEGAQVLGVAEIMPYSNGLNRNIVQCLNDFNIPLYLSHTVTKVEGGERLEKITISEVDRQFNIIKNTEKSFSVDTLLLSVGLIPENTLLKDIGADINPVTNGAYVDDKYETSIDGVFACGNALHVHDLVDYASEEGYEAGKNAALYINNKKDSTLIKVQPSGYIRYTVPTFIRRGEEGEVNLKFRVSQPVKKGVIIIKQQNTVIKEIKKSPLIPSEMEIVKINKSLLENFNLTIEVRSED